MSWPSRPLLAVVLSGVLAFNQARAAEALKGGPPLEDAIRLADQNLPLKAAIELPLPPLPVKAGKTIVLRFRMVSYAKTPAGCNMNATVEINGTPLGRYTAAGNERLLGRLPSFEFTTRHGASFPIFNGSMLTVMFAPDVDTGDQMAKDGRGATFTLEIADVVRGVDGNSISFRNLRKPPANNARGELIVRDIVVGWLDHRRLPEPQSTVPQRPPLATVVRIGSIGLSCGRAGGFSVSMANQGELLVETGVGMSGKVPSDLIASDTANPRAGAHVQMERFGPAGFALTAVWPALKLARTVELQGGIVRWTERWTNTGKTIAGVPFRHRLFLRSGPTRFYLAGSTDLAAVAASAENPTLFLQSGKPGGEGFGVAAESDWLRLLLAMQAQAGVGEIYSQTLALAPGASVDFTFSITPVEEGGSYWTFINALRQRWGLNAFCVERPIFWSFARAAGCKTPEETFAKSLSHLGPVTVALGPWLRSEADIRTITAGRYPKLAATARPAPGGTPDADVEAFLTFQHRAVYQEQFRQDVESIRRAVPGIKVLQRMHPAMEAVYRPAAERWPYAADAIRDECGRMFEDGSYSRVWLGRYVAKGWSILYFVPRPGSAYLQTLLAGIRESLDGGGSDGIYCDEFSWASRTRGYSRYDYSRWDGYSADLDEEGGVARLKSDNAFTTESAQLQIVQEVLRRGKFFLGNGGAALRSVGREPVARFAEGGNGVPSMAGAHLASVPLVLGNFGEERTRQGIFEAVKTCLSMGCVYSPDSGNLLLEGPHNFVCKLYPITIRKLGPGWIEAQQRLITCVSQSFPWPGYAAHVRIYRYDGKGNHLGRPQMLAIPAGPTLDLSVPKDGLVIAEIADPPRAADTP